MKDCHLDKSAACHLELAERSIPGDQRHGSLGKLGMTTLFIFGLLMLLSLYFSYTHRPYAVQLGAFSTSLNNRTLAQLHNFSMMVNKLDGWQMAAGEELSFNKVLGTNLGEQGFVPERSMLDGDMVAQAGGGVCQVASTLYNAALLAGLEIVARSAHSMAVSSVPSSMDAAIASDYKDLKIKNNYAHPVKIIAKLSPQRLTLKILGSKSDQSEISLHRESSLGLSSLHMDQSIHNQLVSKVISIDAQLQTKE